jgi:hypothetical protein
VEFASAVIIKNKHFQFQQSRNVSFFFLSLEMSFITHALGNLERCFGIHVSTKEGSTLKALTMLSDSLNLEKI